MTTVVEQRSVPDEVTSLLSLGRIDYADPLFTVLTEQARNRTPEQWARALLEDAAGQGGQFVWRYVVRFDLGSGPDHVGGWKIGDAGDDWIRLEAASWFVAANAVLRIDDGRVSVAVFLRYDQPVANIVCPPVMSGHRRVMPRLLRHAVRSMR